MTLDLRSASLAMLVSLVAAGCGGSATATAPAPSAVKPAAAPKVVPGPVNTPSVTAVLPKEKEAGAPLPPIAYEPKNRRDPFAPVVLAKEERRPLNLGPVKLVGVVQGSSELLALVETPDGLGYILKPGDVLGEGQVAHITPRSVTFTMIGKGSRQVTSLTLKLFNE